LSDFPFGVCLCIHTISRIFLLLSDSFSNGTNLAESCETALRTDAPFAIAESYLFSYTTTAFYGGRSLTNRDATEYIRAIGTDNRALWRTHREGLMTKEFLVRALVIMTLGIGFVSPIHVHAQTAPAAPTAPAPLDIVTLKDGSTIYGEVIELVGGVLYIKTSASPDNAVKVKWDNVAKLSVNHPIPFHLKEGSVIIGTATAGADGMLNVQAEPLKGTMEVPLASITSMNPVIQPPVIYSGSLTGGYSQTTGNSHLRNASLLGDFVARSEQLRLSINGRYVYGDNANTLIARNARGTIKLDFFITKRLFWFASAYFENDRFQDLKMRTALASGPGYQWIDRGDFNGIFKDMTFYTEAGLSYFNEDFNVASDQSSFRARLSAKLNWPLFDDRVTLYHFSELFPSLENTSNYFLTMDNGVRFKIWEGFVSGFQVTTRYNSRPARGTGDTDNLYLWTLGYSFDTTRRR
jgi:putative salt-induced outer membrane protein YdiY